MRRIVFILLVYISTSCQEQAQIEGLWELQELNIDMYKKHTPSIYLQFDQGGSFRLSQKQGDIIGFYELDGTKLELSSTDDKWFNTNWDAFTKENIMVLTGLEYGYRTTDLRF